MGLLDGYSRELDLVQLASDGLNRKSSIGCSVACHKSCPTAVKVSMGEWFDKDPWGLRGDVEGESITFHIGYSRRSPWEVQYYSFVHKDTEQGHLEF